MGDTYSVVFSLPQPDEWERDRVLTVAIYRPDGKLHWSGAVVSTPHSTLFSAMEHGLMNARRQLRPWFR